MTVHCPECSEVLYENHGDDDVYVASEEIKDAMYHPRGGNEATCPHCETVVLLEDED